MDSPKTARPTAAQHFLTAGLDEGRSGVLTDHVATLQLAWRACRDRYPFTLTAGVILPDHLHCIVAIPADDPNRSARWGLLRELFQHVVNGRSSGVWLEERPLRDRAEVERSIDYIHADPVRHGWARCSRKWPYSSLHAYIEKGLRPLYWTGAVEGGYGARGTEHGPR
ncbi:MAG TPA: transposase [Casimicrobiaceae bacterium]|nr:transposase [Casimicrobiaceae bacterium]